jgi:hypothetical protein
VDDSVLDVESDPVAACSVELWSDAGAAAAVAPWV